MRRVVHIIVSADESPLSKQMRPIMSGLPSQISAFGDGLAEPGTPPHAEHGSRATASDDGPHQHLASDPFGQGSDSSSKPLSAAPLTAQRRSNAGFGLPSHISAFGDGSLDTPGLQLHPEQGPAAADGHTHRGHWNDNGFMDKGMAGGMGLQQGNGHAASGSAGSTDDDPQLRQLAEGMMSAAIDSSGSTAGPNKHGNSIWQPAQGSTSKPPGGASLFLLLISYALSIPMRCLLEAAKHTHTDTCPSNFPFRLLFILTFVFCQTAAISSTNLIQQGDA